MDAMLWLCVFAINVAGLAAPQPALPKSNVCTQGACSDGFHQGMPRVKGQSLLQQAFNIGVVKLSNGSNDTRKFVPASNSTPAFIGEGIEGSKAAHTSILTQHAFGAASVSLFVLLLCIIVSMSLVWYCYTCEQSPSDKLPDELVARNEKGKVYSYSNEQLLTWQIFLSETPSIVMSWRMWVVVPCVLGTAYIFVLMIMFKMPYANLLDTEKMDEFGRGLRVFIAFMLGLFMNNSFQRWQSSVSSFRQMLTSIKQLLWTARVMKLRKPLLEELERKCLLACYILDAEMRTDIGCRASAWQVHWDRSWSFLREAGLLTEMEDKAFRGALERQHEFEMGRYSTMVWSWIGELVSRIREEPGVLVPMFIRLVAVSHASLGQVDQLKTCVQVQVPFTYSYLLSMLVHLNNAILAICSGLQIGASLSELNNADVTSVSEKTTHGLYKSVEILGMQTVILLIQPLMYQACLVIAHTLNHPFGDHICHLPTETFILMLRDELQVLTDAFEQKGSQADVDTKSKSEWREDEDDDADEEGEDEGDDEGDD